ncbi:hypothetical protein ACTXT7_003080 [Hymenolepis weldensis]
MTELRYFKDLGKQPVLIMEYASQGTLLNYLLSIRPNGNTPLLEITMTYWWTRARRLMEDLLNFATDIASALLYLENIAVSHGDVAARNVLLTGSLTAKLGDFGMACVIPHGEFITLPVRLTNAYYNFHPTCPEDWLRRKISNGEVLKDRIPKDNWGYSEILVLGLGSPDFRSKYHSVSNVPPVQMNFKKIPVRWSAPEVILSNRRHARSDAWSFGVLLWEIFSFGETPYAHIDSEEAVGNYVSIEGGRLCRPSISADDDDLYKLMTSCWSTCVEQRPGFQALLERLRLATKEKIDSTISLDSDLTDKNVSSQSYLPMDT